MGDRFVGTRAEREWLATLKRIADALEQVADSLEAEDVDEEEDPCGD